MSEEAYRRKLPHCDQGVIAVATVAAPLSTAANSAVEKAKSPAPTPQPERRLRYAVMTAGVVMLLFGLAAQSGHGAERHGVQVVNQGRWNRMREQRRAASETAPAL